MYTPTWLEQFAELLESKAVRSAFAEQFYHCCAGAAVYGPHRCTCWETRYNLEQREFSGVITPPREKCCSDCAYRHDSPERSGNQEYSHSAEVAGDIPEFGPRGRFFCHVGMRHSVKHVHVPTGVEIPGNADDYCPPTHHINGEQYLLLANGDTAPLCAGFCAVTGDRG